MKSCVSDGANAMLGAHNGMVAHIRKKVPDLVNIHCVSPVDIGACRHMQRTDVLADRGKIAESSVEIL